MIIMNLQYSDSFKKQYKKAPLYIREQFEKRLIIFLQDKINPILNNHSLQGKYAND
jgi:mRNA-degrading endonuclease RelE of RelBE toxin-antitoxin system